MRDALRGRKQLILAASVAGLGILGGFAGQAKAAPVEIALWDLDVGGPGFSTAPASSPVTYVMPGVTASVASFTGNGFYYSNNGVYMSNSGTGTSGSPTEVASTANTILDYQITSIPVGDVLDVSSIVLGVEGDGTGLQYWLYNGTAAANIGNSIASGIAANGGTTWLTPFTSQTANLVTVNTTGIPSLQNLTSLDLQTLGNAVTVRGSFGGIEVFGTVGPSGPPAQPIITLTATAPGTYGSNVNGGTALTVTGSNGVYTPAQTGTTFSTQLGLVEGNGFNPTSDPEVYALALTDTGSLSTDLAKLVADINALGIPGASATTTAPANDPFGSQYNVFVTFNSPPSGDNFLGFDLSQDSSLSGLDVTGVALVPEPASVGLLTVGAMGLLARRRRSAVQA